MSKEREHLYICENCDKKTDTGYFDKETGQVLCRKCFNERQRDFKDKRIADLEAKLAEKEHSIGMLNQHLTDKAIEIERLSEELKEKESEIKVGEFWHSAYQGKQLDYDKVYAELRQSYDEIEKLQHYNDRLAQGIYHSYGEHFVSKINQDKISFCIEKLEQIKKFYNEYNYSDKHTTYEVLHQLDRKIKQLKEGK